MGTGFVAELDGEIFGAAYVLDAFLYLPGGETKKLAYIYAVSVDESAQGAASAPSLRGHACETHGTTRQISAARCRQRMRFMIGTKAAAVLPLQAIADTREAVASAEIDGIRRLCADEYGFLREDMLNGHAHVSFYYGYLRFQEEIFTSSVGGFFEYQGGLVCGYVENGIFYVKEALGDTPEFIPALCASLGAGKAVIRRASAHGERYIAAYQSKDFPPDTVWNLTLD